MSGWQVTPETVEKLNMLATQIVAEADAITSSSNALKDEFEANHSGLGAHIESIAKLIETVSENEMLAGKTVKKFAVKVQRAAIIRKQHIEGNRYGSPGQASGYKSPYVKTTYSGTISYRDPQTKQRVEKISTRDVYENNDINPITVVPAGTKYANGHCVKEDTTNVELMEQGKAPFVLVTNADGSKKLVPVELHHLSGEETHHGSVYFNGSEKDGSIVEIASTVHDTYSGQLHIGASSFRRDADGEKTEDAAKYEKFRSAYWKRRAKKFRQNQQNSH